MKIDSLQSQQFAQLLSGHPSIQLASAQDALRISRFLDSVPMDVGSVQINISRGEDFFALMKKQGHAFVCFLVLENNEIAGLSCVVFRKTLIRGKLEEVGYLQDLRLGSSLSSSRRREFFSFYSEALRLAPHMPETYYCRYFYSAVLKGNQTAKKVLSRPQFPLKYVHFAGYKAFLFPKPPLPLAAQLWSRKAQEMWQKPSSQDEFAQFFSENADHSFFAATWDDVERALPNSERVELRADGQLIGACLLTNSRNLRSYEILVPKLHVHAKFNGVYPFALTVKKTSNAQLQQKWRNALLQKAFLVAQAQKAAFFGLMVAEVNSDLPLFLRVLPKVCIEGAIYRVFHPDHTSSAEYPDFTHGFLRPSDLVSLEMSLL